MSAESTHAWLLETASQEPLLDELPVVAEPPSLRTVAECAYAAGILDGEGSITLSTRRSRSVGTAGRALISMHVSVAQNDRRLLDWLADRWGSTVAGPYPTPYGSLHHYRWQAGGRIAERFLRDVAPYLVMKCVEVENALAFRDYAASVSLPGHGGYDPAIYDQFKLYLEAHRAFGRGQGRGKRLYEYS